MDIKSILGYSQNSPYQNDPFIDIFTPQGLIDMSSTPKDLIGIDNKGNKKKMKAFSKNPYKFEGDVVREIPSNPYMQQGGLQDLYSYLFDDDEDNQPNSSNSATAPDTNELEAQQRALDYRKQQLDEQEQYNLAMQIAGEEFSPTNPYVRRQSRPPLPDDEVNPNVVQTQNDLMGRYNLANLGIWGDKSHQQRKSDHNTGDAQDFSFDTPQTASSAIAQLMQEAKARKVKYIIYDGEIWNPSISNEWRPYEGKNPHKSHFHVSYNR